MADVAQRSIWCLVANVTRAPHTEGTEELRLGTKHFSPGTKLYLRPGQWGDGYERVKAIGRHRNSPKMVEMVVARKRLENFRAKEIFHPFVVQEIGDEWGKGDEGRKRAAAYAATMQGLPAEGEG